MWTRTEKQYFDTINEAMSKADFANHPYKRFGGLHYDGDNDKFYALYFLKY